jgi:uncharacterized protein (DUF305 family)
MRITRPLAAAAALLALAAAGCGSDDSEPAAGGNEVDRAFAKAMIPHHESAVEMAEIAQERGESQFVRKLADDIVGTQNAEIETLRAQDAELEQAGVVAGDLGVEEHEMGMEGDPSMLRSAEAFDREFIDMMIPHHEGAIHMARAELEKGADPELKALAEDIIEAQQREITEMREHIGGGTDDGGSMEDMHHE